MKVKDGIRRIAIACIPEDIRIWRKRRKNRDVIRDGRWLRWQIEKNAGKCMDFPERISDSNLRAWRVLPVDTWRREQEEKRLLSRYTFDFQSMLVIRNPYERTPISCLALFETGQECFVRYVVKGKTADCDFSYTTERIARKHFVPIMGLYASCENQLVMQLLDKNRKIIAARQMTIPMGEIPDKLTGMVQTVKKADDTAMPFVFVTGGINGATYAFDKNGDIRYYLSRTPRQYGIYPMPDGRFLFPEHSINRPTYINPHANVMHDMDLLGRVKETYYVSDGCHHWAEAVPGTQGRKVLMAASTLDESMEDMIVCLNRDTGRVERRYNLRELFPEKYLNRFDWAHLNRICCCGENHILVSLRNMHTVAKLDLKIGKILWVLAHPDMYKGTELEQKVLEPIGNNFHYFLQQHAVQDIDLQEKRAKTADIMEVMLFDNHCMTKRKVSWFDEKEQSYVCFYRIDEKKMTVETVRIFSCDLSPTRSNAWFEPEKRSVFAMAGAAGSTPDGEDALIYEWNFDSGKEISCYKIKQGFFKAYPFSVQDKSLERYLDIADQYRKGRLESPARYNGECKGEKRPGWMLGDQIQVEYLDDLILIRAQDHKVQKVYFCGKEIWVKDFTDTFQKSRVFAEKTYYVAVPTGGLRADRYQIVVQYEGEIYDTGKWFQIPK